MDLSTKFLGWTLPHPFVVGSSPLGDTVDGCRQLEDAGAAAIVLRSLFEEYCCDAALAHYRAEHRPCEPHRRVRRHGPVPEGFGFDPDQYLDHLHKVKKAVAVPVIASLNGCSHEGWVDFGKGIDQAGADALELNLYEVVTDAGESGEEIENRSLAAVHAVRQAVRLPVAVKLSPFYTSLPNFALRLKSAGADALVLFNRAFEPDVDVEVPEVRPHMELSTSHELLLRLRWLAVLSAQLDRGLAVSGGVHTVQDALKAVLCGAHVVQVVAVLLRGGIGKLAELRSGVARWLEENRHPSLAQLRGRLDSSRNPDPHAFERASYMRMLAAWRPEP